MARGREVASTPDLSEAARLYALPLAEFTTARDALARQLAAAGDKAAAASVKQRRKPSVPAWAANQVVWHAPDEWRRLREATESLRSAHQSATLAELRQAARRQREALRACEARAAESLAAAGHAASPTVTLAISGTLLAVAHGAGDPGRLERELQAPGFDALLGLDLGPVPAADREPPREPQRTPPAQQAAAGSEQTHAARESEQREREQRARERRHAALVAAQERVSEARRAVEEARTAVSASEGRRRALEQELVAADQAGTEARERLAAAEAAQAVALAELQATSER